jgi:N-acetylmuramoyl-L-alanine amidase
VKIALLASVVALLASVFFVDSSTPESLRARYAEAKAGGSPVKILIVPGHDNDASGTEYQGMKEADLTLALGKQLHAQLSKDPFFKVMLARNDKGYDPELATYFKDRRADIITFQKSQRGIMKRLLSSGDIASNFIVGHNAAPSEVAIRLYGINKWANDNHYDLVIHIHLNDVPRASRSKPGAYTGFSIYIPEKQFSNAKGSRAVADAVRKRLAESYASSTLPLEKGGLIEDQELIAIGSNNSLDGAGILVEYGYIYEPMLLKASTRAAALSTMAEKTYQGVEDFFNPTL